MLGKKQKKERDKEYFFYFVHETDRWGLEGVLLWQVDFHFPDPALIGGTLGPEKLDDELVQAAENGHFVFAFDQFDHVSVHTTFSCTW